MHEYIKSVLDELLQDMDGTAKTPAAKLLFYANNDARKPSQDKAELFDYIVANQATYVHYTR